MGKEDFRGILDKVTESRTVLALVAALAGALIAYTVLDRDDNLRPTKSLGILKTIAVIFLVTTVISLMATLVWPLALAVGGVAAVAIAAIAR